MTTSGWIIMIISVGGVCSLFTWCLWKVLSTPQEAEHLQDFGGNADTPDAKPSSTDR